MKKLVLLLLVGLGWAAWDHLGKRQARLTRSDAFPFPTQDDHDVVSLSESDGAAHWAATLGCSEAELRAAVDAVGRSVPALRVYLARSL